MKNFAMFLFIILCIKSASAQLKKGNRFVNGTFSLSATNQEPTGSSHLSSKISSFSIQPRIGFFTSDNTVIGFGVGYNYFKNSYKYDNSPSNINKMISYSINPFLRRYFSLGEKVAFFLDGRVNLAFGNSKTLNQFLNQTTGLVETFNVDENTFSSGISIKAGVAFFISQKWSAEANFANFSVDYSRATDSKSNSTGINMSYALNPFSFGFSYYISR